MSHACWFKILASANKLLQASLKRPVLLETQLAILDGKPWQTSCHVIFDFALGDANDNWCLHGCLERQNLGSCA